MKYTLYLMENSAFFLDWIIIIWSGIACRLWRVDYGLNNPGLGSRQGNEIFFLLQIIHTDSESHPGSLVSGYRASFPRVKRPGRKVDHSSSFIAEVKNEWSYTYSLPMRHRGVYKENFICIINIIIIIIINIIIISYFACSNLEFDRLSECTVPNCDISDFLHQVLYWLTSSLCQSAERKMVNFTLQFPCGLESWQHLYISCTML